MQSNLELKNCQKVPTRVTWGLAKIGMFSLSCVSGWHVKAIAHFIEADENLSGWGRCGSVEHGVWSMEDWSGDEVKGNGQDKT
jgi:hypothetical protein